MVTKTITGGEAGLERREIVCLLSNAWRVAVPAAGGLCVAVLCGLLANLT